MCISLATAALIGAGASVASTVYSARQASKEAGAARRERQQADAQATQSANARLAMRRRALAANSLVTDQSGGATGMASGGRATLGGE